MSYKDPEKRRIYQRKVWKKKYSKRQKQLADFKRGLACVDCGFLGKEHPSVLDFDHRDRAEKKFEVGQAFAQNYKIERIMEEIAKCDVVCANCHRIREVKRKLTTSRGVDKALKSIP